MVENTPESVRSYQKEVLRIVTQDAYKHDPVRQRCRVREFVNSKQKHIIFLIVDRDKVYVIDDEKGIIKRNKKRDLVGPDVLAMEMLTDMQEIDRTEEALYERVMALL